MTPPTQPYGSAERTVPRGAVLTDENRERIELLATQGLSSKQIANAIGRNHSTVCWFMYTVGLKAAKPAPAQARTYVRNGRTIRLYTADEDEFLVQQRKAGLGFTAIAKLVNHRFDRCRTPHTVHCRLVMLAAQEDVE